MARRRSAVSLCALAATLLLSACSSSVYRDVYPTLIDGRYDSEFPYKGCSKQLEEISETVQMLNCIAYYRTYPFGAGEKMTREGITRAVLRAKEPVSVYVNNTSAGTATSVYYNDRNLALLTCAHIVDFEDTLISYYIDEDRRPTRFIKSIAVKEKQTNYVAVLPEGGEVEILAIDRVTDIALVGKRFVAEPPAQPRVFNYPSGHARDLEWGTFVYLFGYPSGYKMVTKGIISSPNKDKRGTFMVDAMFSRGFSGGIALAIRDGVPNFELVGIIKLVSAHSSYVLTPWKENGDVVFDPSVPYTGNMYVERKTEVESGITLAVPVEAIRDFIRIHSDEIRAHGYVLTGFLRPD
jgi:hypothetical protein